MSVTKKEYLMVVLIAAAVSALVSIGTVMLLSALGSPINTPFAVTKPSFSIIDMGWDELRDTLIISIMNSGTADASEVVMEYQMIGAQRPATLSVGDLAEGEIKTINQFAYSSQFSLTVSCAEGVTRQFTITL